MYLFLLFFIGLICFFQGYYILHTCFVDVRKEACTKSARVSKPAKISVLIPLHNSSTTIGECLESVLQSNGFFVADVVVVVDHCTDDSEEIARSYKDRFRQRTIALKVISLPSTLSGKVAGLLEGGKHCLSRTILLLDADIILERTAIEELVQFHVKKGNIYSSCLVYPYQNRRPLSLTGHFICHNRLYRQNILQNVKNRYEVSNFPGGIQLVDFERYRKLLVEGFLEDLAATYQVLASGGKISILPKVLAYEIERQTIVGVLLQRMRWTIGAIENIPAQARAVRANKGLNQKILISSYHVMWELQYYAITLGVLVTLFGGKFNPYFLMPLILYTVQIGQSAHLARKYYRNSIAGIAFHCIFYPIMLTVALGGSLVLLVKKRRFFFTSEALFRRDYRMKSPQEDT